MRQVDFPVEDLRSLCSAVALAYSTFGHGQVWWRGQKCALWSLSPRVFDIEGGYRFEQNAIKRFMQRAPTRHARTPPDGDLFPWLFLMQHYRLPTRLLDWTESPMVACFYSVTTEGQSTPTQPESPQDGALFALSPYLLNIDQVKRDGALMPSDPLALQAVKRAFDARAAEVTYVTAILPTEIDPRMMVQQSTFTVHPPEHPLDKLSASDGYLLKFIVPVEAKDTLIGELKQMGVHESTIYPDLEHLSHEVSRLHFADPEKSGPLPPASTYVEFGARDPASST